MKLISLFFVTIFSINIYAQEVSTLISELEKITGKWTEIDFNNLDVIISKPDLNSKDYTIKFQLISSTGKTGEFEGKIIASNEKSFLMDEKGNKLGFFTDEYFITSLDNQIVGSLKILNDMLYFQNFINLCDLEGYSSCGMGISLDSSYLERIKY